MQTLHAAERARRDAADALAAELDGDNESAKVGELTAALEAAERSLEAVAAVERARARATPHHGPDGLAEALATVGHDGGTVALGQHMAERAITTSTDADLVPDAVAANFLSSFRSASPALGLANTHAVADAAGFVAPVIAEVLVPQVNENTAASEDTATVSGELATLQRYSTYRDVGMLAIRATPLAIVEGIAQRLMNGAGLAAEARLVNVIDSKVPSGGQVAAAAAGAPTPANFVSAFGNLDPYRVEGPESRAAWLMSTAAYNTIAADTVGSSDLRALFADSWAERIRVLQGLPVYRITRNGSAAWTDDFTGSTDQGCIVADLAEAHVALAEPFLTVDEASQAASGNVRVAINAFVGAVMAVGTGALGSVRGA